MSNWVQKDAAELLSISPRVMNYKIKTLGIEFPRGRRAAAGRAAGQRTDGCATELDGPTHGRLRASTSDLPARGCALR